MSDSSPSVFPHLLFIYLFVLHGVIQAAQSEWQTLAASARPHDRLWLTEKLGQVNVETLRKYVTDAGVSLGRNPAQRFLHISLTGSSIPVAPWFCRK